VQNTYPNEIENYFSNNCELVHGTPKGRGVIATRDIEKGEELFRERSFVHVSPSEKKTRCAHCMSPHPQSMCFECFEYAYCSNTNCKEKDWRNGHEFECNAIKEKKNTHKVHDFDRLSLRVIGKCNLNGNASKIVQSLHVVPSRQFMKSDGANIYDKHLYSNLSLIGITKTSRAIAMFVGASMFNHSCAPNCRESFLFRRAQSPTIVYHAMRKIEKGEELFVSYVDYRFSYKERREKLEETYGFVCECSRCISEASNSIYITKDLNLFNEPDLNLSSSESNLVFSSSEPNFENMSDIDEK